MRRYMIFNDSSTVRAAIVKHIKDAYVQPRKMKYGMLFALRAVWSKQVDPQLFFGIVAVVYQQLPDGILPAWPALDFDVLGIRGNVRDAARQSLGGPIWKVMFQEIAMVKGFQCWGRRRGRGRGVRERAGAYVLLCLLDRLMECKNPKWPAQQGPHFSSVLGVHNNCLTQIDFCVGLQMPVKQTYFVLFYFPFFFPCFNFPCFKTSSSATGGQNGLASQPAGEGHLGIRLGAQILKSWNL